MPPPQHLTLSALQEQVKMALSQHFALPVWVMVEVAELKVNYSGHCYLELVEKGERDGLAKAQARGVIWRTHYAQLSTRFSRETGRPLSAGIRLLVKATVNYHELYGFSLQITDIDTSYTLGEMERRRQATIAQLQKEGVWEMNHLVQMPPVVQRIAVLSSRQAAGWQDFCNELKRSPYAFRVELFDAYMQGEAAEDSLIAALYAIHERMEEFDVVVVIRGGGATSDLGCFDAYHLCSHIAQFPLPILTGIGHDKDISVADRVAHTALKTPTAVAGWLIERMQQVEGWLDTAALRLHDLTMERLHHDEHRLEGARTELQRISDRLFERERGNIELLKARMQSEIGRLFEREKMRLTQAEELTLSHAPSRLLKLGFSIVRHQGQALTDSTALKRGAEIEIEFSNGRRKASIE
uniref:exodeoxyribonuclease VII large subunit n=1 Tax=Alistipes sp. TaxID=1872444 RepID=UPI004055CEFD